VAGCNDRALCPLGVDIDKADVHAGKGLSALHIDRIANGTRAVGQMASVTAGEGTVKLDVLDRVLVIIAERERDQGF